LRIRDGEIDESIGVEIRNRDSNWVRADFQRRSFQKGAVAGAEEHGHAIRPVVGDGEIGDTIPVEIGDRGKDRAQADRIAHRWLLKCAVANAQQHGDG
jgi:hypothetical protein